jgi:hypothetical protein
MNGMKMNYTNRTLLEEGSMKTTRVVHIGDWIKVLVQHHLIWFGHIKQRPVVAPICSRVIRWIGNVKRDRIRSNLIWEESVKRDWKN